MNDIEWRHVVGYEGIYEVSEYGDIRFVIYRHGNRLPEDRLKKVHINKYGYYRTRLNKLGEKPKTFNVHALVARAFLGERPPNYDINHKDGVKTNNHVSNLEYVTKAENARHAIKNKLYISARGVQFKRSNLTEENIREIRKKYANGMRQHVIAKEYGVSQTLISSIVRRQWWAHVE